MDSATQPLEKNMSEIAACAKKVALQAIHALKSPCLYCAPEAFRPQLCMNSWHAQGKPTRQSKCKSTGHTLDALQPLRGRVSFAFVRDQDSFISEDIFPWISADPNNPKIPPMSAAMERRPMGASGSTL